jgi:hypothetical protein
MRTQELWKGTTPMKLSSRLISLAPAALLLLTAQFALSQLPAPVLLQVTDADTAAQSVASPPVIHRPNTTSGAANSHRHTPNNSGTVDPNASTVFALDMTNPDNNPSVVTAQHHNIFVNLPPSTWGDPDKFLTDLGQSKLIRLVDEYVGAHTPNRYTLGTSFQVFRPAAVPGNTVADGFLQAVVHAAAVQTGSGYGHIYHIYLGPGVDVCYSSATICYSPDKPANMVFCAFHSAFFFYDAVGLTLFTVEPYQNVAVCNVAPGTPNGETADSTYDALSHEVFETITDPVPPTPGLSTGSWISRNLNFGEFDLSVGLEVADACERWALLADGTLHSANPNIALNGNLYSVQTIYSNKNHGCNYSVGNGDIH